MEPDWSNLPKDIIEAVSKKITSPPDYLRLRAVCTPWRSALSPSPRHLQPLLPWLLLPYDPNLKEGKDASLRFFYDMSNLQIRRIHLPETCGKQYCGSSKGWLVLQDGPEMSLLNPITKVQIQLPSLNVTPTVWRKSGAEFDEIRSRIDIWPSRYEFKEHTDAIAKRIVLTSSPSLDHDCIVMALFKSNWSLAFCRIGDESWTLFEAPTDNGTRWSGPLLIDATYQNGMFYSFSYDEVRVYDLKDSTCKVIKVIVPLEQADCHLMEGDVEELLLVAQHRAAHGLSKRDVFGIYKLGIVEDEEGEGERHGWIETRGVRNRMCFICEGINQCFTLPADSLQTSTVMSENSLCYAYPCIVEKIRKDWGWYPEDKFGYDIKMVKLPVQELPNYYEYWRNCVVELAKELGSDPTTYSRAVWIVPSFY